MLKPEISSLKFVLVAYRSLSVNMNSLLTYLKHRPLYGYLYGCLYGSLYEDIKEDLTRYYISAYLKFRSLKKVDHFKG